MTNWIKAPPMTSPELLTPKKFVDDILSACDASNWDADRNTGDYYKGLRDAYEHIHEIAGEYQTAMYRWNTRAPSTVGVEAVLADLLELQRRDPAVYDLHHELSKIIAQVRVLSPASLIAKGEGK